MNNENNLIDFQETASRIQSNQQPTYGTVTVYRFDLFRGVKDSSGKVLKIKSVGSSYIREGLKTYTVHLKSFLKDTFYLLPNTRQSTTPADFVILTRELAQNSGKKYFWNSVGEGHYLDGENDGLMELAWDLLALRENEGIFMTLAPFNVSQLPDAVEKASEVA